MIRGNQSNKPIMEKRRRARINNCLNELKTLILDAMKKDPARHSKLEKADILEMTVKHLENLQRQQVAMSAATDPGVLNKFRAGFSECAGEVGRFPGLDSPVRRRLLQHLANCLNGAAPSAPPTTTSHEMATTPPGSQHTVQVHILPSPGSEGHHLPTAIATSSNGIFLSTTETGGGLQLVPTRLPNGDIALVLPASGGAGTTQILRQTISSSPVSSPAPSSASSTTSSSTSPLPMLIPIPSRTSSASSASSTSSRQSSASSPVAFDRLTVSSPVRASFRDVGTSYRPQSPSSPGHSSSSGYEIMERAYSPIQTPLSLVMRKTVHPSDEEKPWRPW
uniref:Hairy n=1 Tax=Timema genevievae TaxID=629358 RepID=A0A7R9K5U7_TIMGE|nr:unnamed protein product [Timema genevievae]